MQRVPQSAWSAAPCRACYPRRPTLPAAIPVAPDVGYSYRYDAAQDRYTCPGGRTLTIRGHTYVTRVRSE